MIETMTKKGKGGRPAWIEREGDPKRLYTVNLYESQLDYIKGKGGAEWLRKLLDRMRSREERRKRRYPHAD